MKLTRYILLGFIAVFVAVSCYEGIDPISRVEPGADLTAPVIKIISPAEGYQIKVPDLVSSITIDFEVTDDIELGTVVVKINGAVIGTFNEFKDYRRLVNQVVFNNVVIGAHVIEITATDLEGKSTTVKRNFEKVSPYNKKYDGEIFYMPFDGDYMEMISFNTAAKVGNPGFAGQGVVGENAYKGAKDAYLTFPVAGLKNNSFSGAFWYKVNANPSRSGILTVGATADNRNQGFRLFREGGNTSQTIKLNVGTGAGESWNDGGAINPAAGEWVHIAFTISPTKSVIYFNGAEIRTATLTNMIDWTGCENLVIGSGGPTFSYWDHFSDHSFIDELRFFNKELTRDEIQQIIFDDSPYIPKYSGEIFYLPFEGNYREQITNASATVVGNPGFAAGKKGQAYSGAVDSYLQFPSAGLTGSAMSAVFWMKINAIPDRAGILVMGPPDPANPTAMNNRKNGFRFFRENAAGKQRFKLNTGNGTADTWFDGLAAADVDHTTGNWVHMAFTFGGDEAVVYINGEVVKQGAFSGIDWTGCDILTIMSGTPRFTGWNHFSDHSLMDELRIFNKALTQQEVRNIMNAEK